MIRKVFAFNNIILHCPIYEYIIIDGELSLCQVSILNYNIIINGYVTAYGKNYYYFYSSSFRSSV